MPWSEVNTELSISKETFDLGPIRLPVFVRVADFAQYLSEQSKKQPRSNHELADFLGSRHHGNVEKDNLVVFGPDLNKIIRVELESNRVVVVLDGLDEVTTSRQAVLQAVEDFMTNHVLSDGNTNQSQKPSTRNQIVVTSRIAGYRASSIQKAGVARGVVQKMNRIAVSHFCDSWMLASFDHVPGSLDKEEGLRRAKEASAGLQQALFSSTHPTLYQLASNPLLLTVLAVIYKKSKNLPRKRTRVYDAAINFMADKWRETKSNRETGNCIINESALMESLIRIGYYFHGESRTGYLSKEKLLKHLKLYYCDAVRAAGETEKNYEEVASVLFQRLHESVGLLAEKANECYGFIHLSFEEFLAGRELVRIEEPEKTLKAIQNLSFDPRWKEPIALGLGYASIHWHPNHFNSLISRLIECSTEEDVLPRTTLLVVHSLNEFEDECLGEKTVEKLQRQLVTFYAKNASRPSGFVCRQLLCALKQTTNISSLREVLASVLKSIVRAGSCQDSCTAAVLLERLELLDNGSRKELSVNLYKDHSDFKWPIHGTLRRASSPRQDTLLQVYLHPGVFIGGEFGEERLNYSIAHNSERKTLKEIERTRKNLQSLLKDFEWPYFFLENYEDDFTINTLLSFWWMKCIVFAAVTAASHLYNFLYMSLLCKEDPREISVTLASLFGCFSPPPLLLLELEESSVRERLALTENFGALLDDDKESPNSNRFVRQAILKLFQKLRFVFPLAIRRLSFINKLRRFEMLLSSKPANLISQIFDTWNAYFVTICCTHDRPNCWSQLTEFGDFKKRIDQCFALTLQENCTLLDDSERLGLFDVTKQLRQCEKENQRQAIETMLQDLELVFRRTEEGQKMAESRLDLLKDSVRCKKDVMQCEDRLRLSRMNSCELLVTPAFADSAVKQFLQADNCKMLVRLRQDTLLTSVFVALFGGVALVGYPSKLRAFQKVQLYKHLPSFEQKQLKDLHFAFEENETVARQVYEENMTFSGKMPLSALKSIQPSFRLECMYRPSSFFDKQLIAALQLSESQGEKCYTCSLLSAAKETLNSKNLNVVHDAALICCALGNVEDLLSESCLDSVNFTAIHSALSETLKAVADPASRAWLQLTKYFQPVLDSPTGNTLLHIFFEAFLEFGGRPDPDLFVQMYNRASNQKPVRLYLAAEILACILSEIEKEDGYVYSFDVFEKLFPVNTDSDKVDLSIVILNLSKTCSLHWWGRKKTVPVLEMQHVCNASSSGTVLSDVFTLDLLKILRGIQVASSYWKELLYLLKPLEPDPKLQTLWKLFHFSLNARNLRYNNWTKLRSTRDDLRSIICEASDRDFSWGQALIAIMAFFPNEEEQMFNRLVSHAEGLCNKLESFQLLFWVQPYVCTKNRNVALERCKQFALTVHDLTDRARCYVRLAAAEQPNNRLAFLTEAVSCLEQHFSKDNEVSAVALQEIYLFVKNWRKAESTCSLLTDFYNVLPTKFKKLLLSTELLHPAGMQLLHQISAKTIKPECYAILVLAFRVRDALVFSNSCLELRKEKFIWAVVAESGRKKNDLKEAALRRLYHLAEQGCLDLTVASALCLESLLFQSIERNRIIDILSFLRPASVCAVELFFTWLCCDKLDQDICAFSALIWAEVHGLNSTVKGYVSNLLHSDLDIYRHRAEKLCLRSWRPYYTAFEKQEFLQSVSSSWLLRWIWHNDLGFFETLLSAPEEEHTLRLLEYIGAADELVGSRMIEYICTGPQPSVRKCLMSSLCSLCHLDGDVNRTLPDQCLKHLESAVFFLFLDPDATEFDPTSSQMRFCGCNGANLLQEAEKGVGEEFQIGGSLICRQICEKYFPTVIRFFQEALFVIHNGTISTESQTWAVKRFIRNFTKLAEDNDKKDSGISLSVQAIKFMLSEVLSLNWIPDEKAMDPVGHLLETAKDVNPQVLDVIVQCICYSAGSKTTFNALGLNEVIGNSDIGDLMICLGALARRTPAALCNIADKRPELASILRSILEPKTHGFVACQGALTALASLDCLTRQSVEVILGSLRYNRFTARVIFFEVKNIRSVEDDALELLQSRLNSRSALEVAVVARLLGFLAKHRGLTSSQRSGLISSLQEAAGKLSEFIFDQPLYPAWLSGKAHTLKTLSSLLSETLAEVMRILLQEPASVPYQLGEPDFKGVYQYVAKYNTPTEKDATATPIWYKYRPSRNCWYWTPFENYICWMPVSTIEVRKHDKVADREQGKWTGDKPVEPNQRQIRFLNQRNPKPSEKIVGYNDETVFDFDPHCP